MDEKAADCSALAETTVFLQFFKDMADHRQPGKVIYPLEEILLLCLLSGVGGGPSLYRHRAFRREEARSVAPFPAFRQRDTGARSRLASIPETDIIEISMMGARDSSPLGEYLKIAEKIEVR
jgi:hypothetical protein